MCFNALVCVGFLLLFFNGCKPSWKRNHWHLLIPVTGKKNEVLLKRVIWGEAASLGLWMDFLDSCQFVSQP